MKRIASIALVAVLFLAAVSVWAVSPPSANKDSGKNIKEKSPIVWNDYDDGLKLAAKSKKPIMVDFYTDWCGWCKKLDKTTYADSTVAKYVSDHFIAVKINAESKEALDLPTGTSNGAGVARDFGVRGYPSIWFLDSNAGKITNLPGYRPPEQFIHVLRFIGEEIYKTKSFQEYYTEATSTNK